jgi:O-antigen ligase
MIFSTATVLLLVLSFILVWVAAITNGAFGDATYVLPLCVGTAALAAVVLYRATTMVRQALLALLVFTVTFLNISFRVRGIGEAGLDPQNGLKIAVWLVLLGTAALNLRRYANLLADPVIALFAAFVAVALLSTAWSPVPTYTAACSIGLLAYLSFACLIACEVDERTTYVALSWGLASYLVANWVTAAVNPHFAFLPPYGNSAIYRLQGITGQPNNLGKEAAVFLLLVSAAHWRGYLSRASVITLTTLGLVTVVATNSRTALIAVLLAWSLVQLQMRRLLLPAFVAALAMGTVLTFASATGTLPDFGQLAGLASRTGNADEVLTLTGRTEFWGTVWQKIMESPLLGYGYNAYEATMSTWQFGAKDAAAEAHNTILQALFTVGFIGAAPFMAALVVLVCRAISRPSPPRDLFTYYLLVSGMAEAEMVSIPELLTLMALLVFAYDAVGRRTHAAFLLQPAW